MSSGSAYAELFAVESREQLDAMNRLLLDLEESPDDADLVGGLFRVVHTIKGNAAAVGYERVSELAHRIENVLQGLRDGERTASPELIDLLLAGADTLDEAIAHASGERDDAPDAEAYVARLATYARTGDDGGGTGGEGGELAPPEPGLWARVRLDPESPLPGARAFMAVRAAEGTGRLEACHPPVSTFQDDDFGGRFLLRFDDDVDRPEIRNLLAGIGDVVEVDFVEATGSGGGDGGPAAPAPGARNPRIRHIRVELDQLDALQNRIGELAILKGRLQRVMTRSGDREMRELSDRASRLIEEIQDEIMSARMVPVWQIFDRFPRVVRDAARALDKEVDFVVEGQEIELDRSLLDEIADPLIHLLRNAVDHGIESPDERREAGKDPEGRLRLSATRERSSVAIRVEDDGRGIDRSAVVKRAVDDGLVDRASAEELPDEEIFRFLGRTGFSTRREVSEISGRGVGLDVVTSRVRALGGQIDVESTPGEGTAFTLRLPFTLAITPALLLRVGDETYALPLTLVSEVVEVRAGEVVAGDEGGAPTLVHRETEVPVVSLRDALETPERPGPEWMTVVVLNIGDRTVGLVADELLDQQEVVVKSFQPTVSTRPYFSGVTVLADGRPALILEPTTVAAEELPREVAHG